MDRVRRLAVCRTATILLAAGVAPHLHAQDLRSVKEPAIPQPCVTLKAQFTAAAVSSGEIEMRATKAGSGEAALDSARIQQALDRCDRGEAVELAGEGGDTAFLTGPIALRPGVTLLVDKGVTLYATRNPEYYAVTPGSCGVVNDDSSNGCKPLIAVRSATGASIMGEGAIDGQGGASLIVDGKPSAKTWWDLGDEARSVGHEQAPRLIDADVSDDFTLYRITLKNAPSTNVSFHRGDGFTAWGVKIDTPQSAYNTPGIVAEQAENITVTQSFLRTGGNDVALKAGDGPTTHVSLVHNHLYWGGGMSIGSATNGGVSGIRVEDLSVDGAENGIRITSSPGHGGLVEDVTYHDVCIRNAKSPIYFDATFSFPGKGAQSLPVYDDITLREVRLLGGGRIQFNGFDDTHRIGVTLDGVMALDGADRYHAGAIHTDLTFGPGPVNLVFTGDDSTVTGKEVKGSLPGCAGKFVPFP